MKRFSAFAATLLLVLVSAKPVPTRGLEEVPLPAEGRGGRFSPDSKWLLYTSRNPKELRIFDLARREVTSKFPIELFDFNFAISVDGRLLATYALDKAKSLQRVIVYELPEGKARLQIEQPLVEKGGRHLTFYSPRAFYGDKLYLQTQDGLQVWDTVKGEKIKDIPVAKSSTSQVRVSTNGQWFLFHGNTAGGVFTQAFNMSDDSMVPIRFTSEQADAIGKNLKIGGTFAAGFTLSGDGKAVYGVDYRHGVLHRWLLPTGSYQGSQVINGMRDAEISADESRLLARFGDDEIGDTSFKVYDTKTMRVLGSAGPAKHNLNIEFSLDGRYVYMSHEGPVRRLFDLGAAKK